MHDVSTSTQLFRKGYSMHLSKILTASAMIAALSVPAMAADTYKSDQGHTEVRFIWDHAGVSMQQGEFTTAEATLTLDQDNVESSSLSASIDAKSVSSGFAPLDEHMLGADFLEVETYPTITFESTSVSRTGDKTADITGDLTLHGTTKSVTMSTTLTHLGEHPLGQFLDYYKGDWAAFTATFDIDPGEFGVGKTIPVGNLTIEITTEMKSPS